MTRSRVPRVLALAALLTTATVVAVFAASRLTGWPNDLGSVALTLAGTALLFGLGGICIAIVDASLPRRERLLVLVGSLPPVVLFGIPLVYFFTHATGE